MTEFKPENKSLDGLRNIQWNIHNENTETMYEIYSKFTIKTPERRQWLCLSMTFMLSFCSAVVNKPPFCDIFSVIQRDYYNHPK